MIGWQCQRIILSRSSFNSLSHRRLFPTMWQLEAEQSRKNRSELAISRGNRRKVVISLEFRSPLFLSGSLPAVRNNHIFRSVSIFVTAVCSRFDSVQVHCGSRDMITVTLVVKNRSNCARQPIQSAANVRLE
jgi:hypothetical protein